MPDTVLPDDLFRLLRCPCSGRPLKLVGDRLVSTDPATRRVYRIERGIPVMLVDESTELGANEWAALMAGPGVVSGD